VRKEKEVNTTLTIIPQTSKVTAMVSDKYLAEMEKALNLCMQVWEKTYMQVSFGNIGFSHSLGVLEDIPCM
jgi:hypothetical protein